MGAEGGGRAAEGRRKGGGRAAEGRRKGGRRAALRGRRGRLPEGNADVAGHGVAEAEVGGPHASLGVTEAEHGLPDGRARGRSGGRRDDGGRRLAGCIRRQETCVELRTRKRDRRARNDAAAAVIGDEGCDQRVERGRKGKADATGITVIGRRRRRLLLRRGRLVHLRSVDNEETPDEISRDDRTELGPTHAADVRSEFGVQGREGHETRGGGRCSRDNVSGAEPACAPNVRGDRVIQGDWGGAGGGGPAVAVGGVGPAASTGSAGASAEATEEAAGTGDDAGGR